jgi:NADPH:quinone reductase-like Zn-dependent oxidoreductase/acyl carrier protein
VPEGVSLEQAATIPVTFQTAWYGLHHLARLRKGESVLIHAGAGGVGLAAILIAKYVGAKIFATAGSGEKRQYLRDLGVDHVMDSRTLAFAQEILQITSGRGVDVVLNSIAGAAVPKSLSVLAIGGRFLEIGKRDIYANTNLGLSPFRKNLSFFAVDMLGLSIEKPDLLEDLTREILGLVETGAIQPLPYTAFAANNAEEAFRFMAQAQHIGKVILTFEETEVEAEVPLKHLIRRNATYLITGGLTGLGLECAQWLAREGAENLVLAGRRAPDAAALETIASMRAAGTHVRAAALDVSDEEQLEKVLSEIRREMPPVAGVIHSAGLVQDAIVDNLAWLDFETVMAPKVRGGWNLQHALRGDNLDFFVSFSSIASMMGSPGQANYSAANSFLDSLSQYRDRLRMPILNLNWGPWSEIGLAARPDRGGRLAETGIPGILPEEGIASLRRLLQKQCDSAAVMSVNWKCWAQYQPEIAVAPFFRNLQGEMQAESGEGAEASFVAQIRTLDRDQALEALEKGLREEVKRVLRIPEDRLDRHTSLTRLGLDSLMAVELKNRIDGKIGIPIPVMILLKGPTLAEMSGIVYEALNQEGANGGLPVNPAAVDTLSDAEVDIMLRLYSA